MARKPHERLFSDDAENHGRAFVRVGGDVEGSVGVDDVRDALLVGRGGEDGAHGDRVVAARSRDIRGQVRREAHLDATDDALVAEVLEAPGHHLDEFGALMVALPVESAE